MAGGNISVLGPTALLDIALEIFQLHGHNIVRPLALFVQPLAKEPGCTVWPVYGAYDVHDLTTVY